MFKRRFNSLRPLHVTLDPTLGSLFLQEESRHYVSLTHQNWYYKWEKPKGKGEDISHH